MMAVKSFTAKVVALSFLFLSFCLPTDQKCQILTVLPLGISDSSILLVFMKQPNRIYEINTTTQLTSPL